MAINICDLKESDIGQWVQYESYNRNIEQGRIKSWNETFIFVVYKCNNEWDRFQDFTAQATNPNDLAFV